MSHIAQYQSQLSGVNEEILKAAAKFVAEQIGGKLSDTIDGYDEGNGRHSPDGQKFLVAIRTSKLPQGLAIVVNDGRVKYFCDRICHAERATNLVRNSKFHELAKEGEAEFKEITSQVEKTYRVLAVTRALNNLGYRVNAKSAEGGTVLTGKKETA